MWIFTKRGFISIVENRNHPEMLVVHSRFKDQIKELFPEARVMRTRQADYLYRAHVSRAVVAEKISKAVKDVDYTNFKDSITGDKLYHDACFDVWKALLKHQEEM